MLSMAIISHPQTWPLRTPEPGGLFPLFSYYKDKLLQMCLQLSSLTSFMNWPPALRKACWGCSPQTPAFALSLIFYILKSIKSIFFFSRYILLPVSFKITLTSPNFLNNSISYSQHNLSSFI